MFTRTQQMIGIVALATVALVLWMVLGEGAPTWTVLLAVFIAMGVFLLLLPSNSRGLKLLVLFGGLPTMIVLLLTRGASSDEKRWVHYVLIGVIAGSLVGGMSLGFYGWFSDRGSGWEGLLALVYGFIGVFVGTFVGALAGRLYGLYKDRKLGQRS